MCSKIHNSSIGIERLKDLSQQLIQDKIDLDDAVDLVINEFDRHLLEMFYGGADKFFEDFLNNAGKEITSWSWELVEEAADILEFSLK